MENTIINIKLQKHHIIKINDNIYKQLKQIGTESYIKNPTIEQTITDLIDFYEDQKTFNKLLKKQGL